MTGSSSDTLIKDRGARILAAVTLAIGLAAGYGLGRGTVAGVRLSEGCVIGARFGHAVSPKPGMLSGS